jgi:hypothetical protein
MDSKHNFRRQFILSSNPKFTIDGWNNIELNKKIYLSAHPEIEICQCSFGNIQLILIGFAVNPFEPLKSNQEILQDIVYDALNFNDITTRTHPIGGRWIIIYMDDKSLKLLHDPCGQRQVYFHLENEYNVVGSDPAIINHFVKLELDDNTSLKEFINSPNFEKSQKAWIGDGTLFNALKHLLPNHYLNIAKRKTHRFWPIKPLENIILENGIELASQILTGSLKAINHRHKLVLAVTSGWDSRLLLSASKEIRNEITYFVSVDENRESIQDVVIPSRIFKLLNIPFYVQKCSKELAPEFEKILKKNVMMARHNLPKAKYIYQYFLEFDGKLSVNGNVCEIARGGIRPIIPGKVTGENLAKIECIDYGGIKYVENQLNDWIEEIAETCTRNKYNIYDLMYWEQRMGNWGAQYPAEQDISIEQFSPFNNRQLLTILLSVDEKFRIFPNYELFYKIMEKLWPETLKVPLGQYGFKSNALNSIKFYIRKMSGVY